MVQINLLQTQKSQQWIKFVGEMQGYIENGDVYTSGSDGTSVLAVRQSWWILTIYATLAYIRHLTLIRMTKNEKGLAFLSSWKIS